MENAKPILDQFLNKTVEYLSSAEAFLKAEVPTFVQEYMNWIFYSSLFNVIIFLLGAVIAAYFINKICKIEYPSDEESGIFIVSCIALVLFSTIIFFEAKRVIKIVVAPRVILLEEVRDLIK